MANGIARGGDSLTTGHNCTPTTTLNALTVKGVSAKVYINGEAVACIGDNTVVHPSGDDFPICSVTHIAQVNEGSTKVFVGGVGVARIGDGADSGAITEGSTNVFAG